MKNVIFATMCAMFIGCSGETAMAKAPAFVPDSCYGTLFLIPDSAGETEPTYFAGRGEVTIAPIPLYKPGSDQPFDSLTLWLEHYKMVSHMGKNGAHGVSAASCFVVGRTNREVGLDPFTFNQGRSEVSWGSYGDPFFLRHRRAPGYGSGDYDVSFRAYGDPDSEWFYIILNEQTKEGAYVKFDASRFVFIPAALSAERLLSFEGQQFYDALGGNLIELGNIVRIGKIIAIEGDWVKMAVPKGRRSSVEGWVRWKDKEGPIREVFNTMAPAR